MDYEGLRIFRKWAKNRMVFPKRTKRSGMMSLLRRSYSCAGSLVIKHDSKNGIPLDDYTHLRLQGSRFPMLKRRLRGREVIQIAVDGNCRWKIFLDSNCKPIFRQPSFQWSCSCEFDPCGTEEETLSQKTCHNLNICISVQVARRLI